MSFESPNLKPKIKTPEILTKAQEVARDRELVHRFNAGDEGAFKEIVANYREKIFSVVFALLRNHHDAEEIAQDTFIRAHRGLARFRGDSALLTWLHRIAVNLARNRYWYNFRRRQHLTVSLDAPLNPTDSESGTFAEITPSDVLTPSEQLQLKEHSDHIGVAMEKLSYQHREILTLRNLLHRSYEEIAAALGISVGTVKSRIARARENLRSKLPNDFPESVLDQN